MPNSYGPSYMTSSTQNYWRCPRCRYTSMDTPPMCRGCGLQIQIDVQMFQQMNYEIKNLQMQMCAPTNNKNKNMSTLGSMMKRLLDGDTQTLVKAGYINGDLELTEKGKNALWAIIFSANKADLVKEAGEELAAAKK